MSIVLSRSGYQSLLSEISSSEHGELNSFQEEIMSRITAAEREQFTVVLTPRDARLLLRLNENNRSARYRIAQTYADDMVSGRWIFNGASICFSNKGLLIDGQHRLSALASIEESHPEISIEFLIITGLDPKAQAVMDQGTKRTTGDNLGLQGIRSPKDVASSARTFLEWTTGAMFTMKGNVGGVEVQEWVGSNPDYVESAYKALKFRKDIDLPVSVYIALYAKFVEIDKNDADDFLEMWATGINLYAGHPVLTLRDRLARNRRERVKVTHRESIAIVVLAWNAYRLNKTLVRFSRPKEGSWTKDNFPSPV